MGWIVSLSAFLFAIVMVFWRLFFDIDVSGWTSLVVIGLFLGGVQLLTIGILGEYIGRIHEQVQRRPVYIIQDKLNFPEKRG
jgi:dolichol-phosphate mannosyltransferase